MTTTATCTFTSTIQAVFDKTGNKSARLVVTGNGNADIKFRLEWDDDPDNAGDAINSITLLGVRWNSPGESGSETNTITNVTPGNYDLSFSGLINDFKSVGDTSIKMVDNDGNDTNAEFEIRSITQNDFTETVTATMTTPDEVVGTNCVDTSWSGTGPDGTAYSKTGPGTNSTSDSGTDTICGGNSDACGGDSPKQRTWTMTTTSPNGCTVSESSTTDIFNDDCPSKGWTKNFINLEPDTPQTLTLGTIQCTDAPVTVTASGDGNFVGTPDGTFNTSREFTVGETVQLKTRSLPFNTSVTSGEFGDTNTKTVNVDFGCHDIDVNVTTKAPQIREDFDFADNINNYPYEDIDLISNTPTANLTTAQIEINDVDVAVEIKVDDHNAQVSINGGGWQNVGEI